MNPAARHFGWLSQDPTLGDTEGSIVGDTEGAADGSGVGALSEQNMALVPAAACCASEHQSGQYTAASLSSSSPPQQFAAPVHPHVTSTPQRVLGAYTSMPPQLSADEPLQLMEHAVLP